MSTSPTRPARAPQARATGDIQRYLRALFQRESPGAYIEVRYRHQEGMRRHFFAHTDTYTAARTIARLGLRTDVYVGVAPRANQDAGGKHAIRRVWTLWADLDDVGARGRLQQLPVAPAIVIASGSAGHAHAYWPLSTPVAIADGELANRRIAATIGACMSAVTNAATILRPPGTYSFKTDPPTPVLLERLDDELTTLYAATAGIAPDPAPPVATAPPAPPARPREDPLRALDPAYYVSALTGQPVGRSRKISCPFHEDRTPSFHVYERPEDGYYCFGCKRYGHTAYDLASALWQLQTRGEDFLQLRARLYELLLPGQTPAVMSRGRAR
jgi:hypothetical protein